MKKALQTNKTIKIFPSPFPSPTSSVSHTSHNYRPLCACVWLLIIFVYKIFTTELASNKKVIDSNCAEVFRYTNRILSNKMRMTAKKRQRERRRTFLNAFFACGNFQHSCERYQIDIIKKINRRLCVYVCAHHRKMWILPKSVLSKYFSQIFNRVVASWAEIYTAQNKFKQPKQMFALVNGK